MARRTKRTIITPTYAQAREELASTYEKLTNKIVNYSHFAGGPWTVIVSDISTEEDTE